MGGKGGAFGSLSVPEDAAGSGAQLPRQPPGREAALIFNYQQALPTVPVVYVQGQGCSLQPPTSKVLIKGNWALILQFVLFPTLFLHPLFLWKTSYEG